MSDTRTYKVEGMTCAACVNAVERAVSKVNGVKNVVVNLVTGSMTVELDEGDLTDDAIVAAVERAGYKAKPENTAQLEVTLLVEGMTCSACAAAVEKAVSRLDGVTEATVNLVTNKATIRFDPNRTNLRAIKRAIEQAGYKPSDAVEEEVDAHQTEQEREMRHLLKAFAISAAFSLPVLVLSMAHMVGLTLPPIPSPHDSPLTYSITLLLLTVPVLIAGSRFYVVGLKSLLRGSPNMDSLVALGTGTAFVYSLANTILVAQGHHEWVNHLYYESAAVIITMVLLGKYLEARSKSRASSAIKKLANLAPKTAILLNEGVEQEVPASELMPGDIVLIKPGTAIPADGTVVAGTSYVDESMLTGESMPVEKAPGSIVYGGTVNSNGALHVKVDRAGRDTVLAQIIRMVEEAQASKAPIQRLADRVSGIFVPTVMGVALVSSLAWLLTGASVSFALRILVSVLVIACPCALGLATPTAILVGSGRGAELGILFKSAAALEALGSVDVVVFDKTGTLTQGKPVVTDVISFGQVDDSEMLRLAASVERTSEHPLAVAIVEAAANRGLNLEQCTEFTSVPGMGASGVVNGRRVSVGNQRLVSARDYEPYIQQVEQLAQQGKTVVLVVVDGYLAGAIALSDTLKSSAPAAVRELRALGLKTVLLTGDRRPSAEAIARAVGVDEVIAEVMPQHKADVIAQLIKSGNKVAMVGDGINDAPALATADVGIAVRQGTDIAMESADVILMNSDPAQVATAVLLSRRTVQIIKQNLFWAFFYNVMGIPVAAGLLYALGFKLLLSPMVAGTAMAFSSVSVVTNALRIKRFEPSTRR
ncbi:heavy metal translocating P-type ATPase [Coprothermobacteraceae bacterium]|nr:heavy metal translocating P-type ATPase [Coprothermobacteraceae bacterium]